MVDIKGKVMTGMCLYKNINKTECTFQSSCETWPSMCMTASSFSYSCQIRTILAVASLAKLWSQCFIQMSDFIVASGI